MRSLSRLVPRVSLRRKLLLVSLVLLIIPWVGYRYVREMEAFLRSGQESALLGMARAVATVLNERAELFARDDARAEGGQRRFFVHTLDRRIFVDGYGDDWGHLMIRAQAFRGGGAEGFRLIGGVYGDHLYVLLKVTDADVVYPPPLLADQGHGDQLYITLDDPAGARRQYVVRTTAPGWAGAYLLDARDKPVRREDRIEAEWQEVTGGYNLELRLPLSMLGGRLGFTLADVDAQGALGAPRLLGMGRDTPANLVLPSTEMNAILRGLEQASARIWVVGRERGVLALAGELRPPEDEPLTGPEGIGQRNPAQTVLHLIYSLILERPDDDFSDELSGVAYLDRPEVDAALAGHSDIRWRRTDDGGALLLCASQPIRSGGEVIGAVMVEQNSNAMLTLQNRALETLFDLTLAVFGAATLVLLLFASRLSARVRRLRDETEAAISPDGRLRTTRVHGAQVNDELGDLAASFNDLLARLGQYTRYLESMASKLSHELRTPLAVVQSSLDNLDMSPLSEDAQVYSRRAREGVLRLSTLLTRMGEATRLEQALQHSEREMLDLNGLISECAAGYRAVYSTQDIRSRLPGEVVPVEGVPDLLVQMLDKLVSNAVDFAAPGTPVLIRLTKDERDAHLSVTNTGPLLPQDMAAGLFDSMVSVREKRGDEPHLGLGLAIVRLITEFHRGTVHADDLPDLSGVVFSVVLPLVDESAAKVR